MFPFAPNMLPPGAMGAPFFMPNPQQQQQQQQQQLLQQPMNTRAADASKATTRGLGARRKDVRADRPAEEKQEESLAIVESPALLCALDEQKRVDDYVQHRRLDIRDSLKAVDRHKRKIRVTVTNTHANQQQPNVPFHPPSTSTTQSEPPSWTLCIHGRILEASDPTGAYVQAPGSAPPLVPILNPQGQVMLVPSSAPPSILSKGHFSDYVRRIEVQLDQAHYPGKEGQTVWDKSLHCNPPRDMFEVKRIGSQPTEVKVKIWLDWQPERYKLPLELAKALGTHYDTQKRVTQAMLQYVSKNNLADPSSPGWVRLPVALAEILAPEELKQQPTSDASTQAILTFDTLMSRVVEVLEPMPPLELSHTISLSGPSKASVATDIDMDVGAAPLGAPLTDPTLAPKGGNVLQRQGSASGAASHACEKELLQLEAAMQGQGQGEGAAAELATSERVYHEAKRRRTALLGFSQAPTDFIHGLAATQAKELRVSQGQQQAASFTMHNIQQNRYPGGVMSNYESMFNGNASMYATEFEAKRRSAIFKEPWAEDAVLMNYVYLSSKEKRARQHEMEGGGHQDLSSRRERRHRRDER